MDGGRAGNFKNGYWMWDEVNNGLLFVSRDGPKVSLSSTNLNVGNKKSFMPQKTTKEMVFREIVDHLDHARFKRYHQRRCKPNQLEVITIQDIKDVTIFLANPKKLSLDFISFFHIPSMDRFLRALIIYFQFYIQVWDNLLLRREEAKRKLYHPMVTVLENRVRDDLADLRSMVSREYCALLIGAEDTRKYHHMLSNENNISFPEKDRNMFETLICMCVRVVWVALQRKNLNLIEMEMNKLLRTNIFNPIAHREQRGANLYATSAENRVLCGQVDTIERKLLHHSLMTKELILGKHDYRLFMLGIKQFEPVDKRMLYLEMALTIPEELLLKNGMLVGMLGFSRSHYDVMLMNLTPLAKKRFATKPRVLPKFTLPPPAYHSDDAMPKVYPKQPCKYLETDEKIKCRKAQLKMWKKMIEATLEIKEISVLELSTNQSQALLSSRSSISMTTRHSTT